MNDKDKNRKKEIELQEKQLFAQRVTALASVTTAVTSLHLSAKVDQILREASLAAKINARHLREIIENQEDQRLASFRQTIIAAIPLLNKEERESYLIEQLLPRVEERYESNVGELKYVDILRIYHFFDFVDNFFETRSDIREYMKQRKKHHLSLGERDKVNQDYIELKKDFENLQSWGAVTLSEIAAKVSTKGNELERLEVLIADDTQKHAMTWEKIKGELVDSFLATDSGKILAETNMESLLFATRIPWIDAEQAFLPFPVRPSRESWFLSFSTKIESEVEKIKPSKPIIKNSLMDWITPQYEKEYLYLAD